MSTADGFARTQRRLRTSTELWSSEMLTALAGITMMNVLTDCRLGSIARPDSERQRQLMLTLSYPASLKPGIRKGTWHRP